VTPLQGCVVVPTFGIEHRFDSSFLGSLHPDKKPTPIFSRTSLGRRQRQKSSYSSEEGRSCCSTTAEGKSTPSLPPALPWHREKIFQHHLQQHLYLHHHLRDQCHPLTVCVDRNPRSPLLNLVHVCDWGFEIILWWSYIFILCYVHYATDHCHDSSLWVLLYVLRA
jgi:hypothetical protein